LRISTAFVLGAGLGTRLRPLTNRRPKPLIPVVNRPLITYAFDHLLETGVERFIVNTHWLSEAYTAAFPEGSYREKPITFRDENPVVLETAGGIWNVRDLLGDGSFIVYNGDILTDLPLDPAIRAHFDRGNEVTMVLRSKDGPLHVAFDSASGRVTDIGRRVDPLSDSHFLFTGIYIVSADFIRRIPPATAISVIPIFCDMIRAGAKLGGIAIDDGAWWDLGSREQYLAVHRVISHCGFCLPDWIHPTAQIADGAQILGATAIGAGARIGVGAILRDCVIWENAEVAPGVNLDRCVVADGARAVEDARESDIV
jgi:NDP-sugar pyrophosphorylase family protein